MKHFIIILELPDDCESHGVRETVQDCIGELIESEGGRILSVSQAVFTNKTNANVRTADQRNADRIDGYDRDDIGPSPDF